MSLKQEGRVARRQAPQLSGNFVKGSGTRSRHIPFVLGAKTRWRDCAFTGLTRDEAMW